MAERYTFFESCCDKFSMDEWKNICFELGIDTESIKGTTKPELIRETILLCERKDDLKELRRAIKRQKYKKQIRPQHVENKDVKIVINNSKVENIAGGNITFHNA